MTLAAWTYLLALVAMLLLIPGAVTMLKGQTAAFIAGLFTLGLVWTVAAFRLGQPDSWWARRFYDETKMERARRRFG
jgi:hypothetical protein